MDLDEYLKKRRILLHGDLPMTSDDLNFGKCFLKEGTQSLSWLDIAGQPKKEANPKVLLEWAYESGHYDPLPLLSRKFPQTFNGYDEKDFRIERLHKLITHKNGQISQLISKLSKTEHKLKKVEDALVNMMNQHQDTITYKVQQHRVGEEDHCNKDIKPELGGHYLGPESQIAPPINAPNGEVNNVGALKYIFVVGEDLKTIESQARGEHTQPVCDSKVDDKIHHWPGTKVPLGSSVPTGGDNTDKDGVHENASADLEQGHDSGSQASGGHSGAVYDDGDFHAERVYGERVHGLSTVICVDTSGSMEGEPFTDMKNAVHKILDDAEYTKNVYEFKELIGLVQCGSGSDGHTVVSLTDNYNQIRRALDRLSPSGMSPLATGIREAVHELKRHSYGQISRNCMTSKTLYGWSNVHSIKDNAVVIWTENINMHKDPTIRHFT
ncbi:uncharacterized protein LOC106173923 [Lingula anatina]|uniref:Uncharacterized protein LOC106173923 n=1 Tax=Lingula anatina TaxID=7574 RepID=A0A1S3JJX4_LINAN|nr:uncharacterized protein LOC106173923 [Lingula anatina]|eukprot:XP_013410715.1 uncharacterized protein LOC106173923 [Lingula anatina]